MDGWTFGCCVCIWHAHTEEPALAISETIFVVHVSYFNANRFLDSHITFVTFRT
jgi:hypothetical protein